jgi:hypothetical protein
MESADQQHERAWVDLWERDHRPEMAGGVRLQLELGLLEEQPSEDLWGG